MFYGDQMVYVMGGTCNRTELHTVQLLVEKREGQDYLRHPDIVGWILQTGKLTRYAMYTLCNVQAR
jgi:hypothetical protein